MTARDLPSAIRAVARVRRRWWGREQRSYSYDAQWADGRVQTEVAVDAMLGGGRFPGDSWAVRRAAQRACPTPGPGEWVAFPSGERLGRK